MHICCESCGTHYRIPIEKMKGDVSKATCKKCGTLIMIRRGENTEASRADDDGVVVHNEDRTVITQVPELKDYQVTPVLEASPLSNSGIPVRMAKGPTPSQPSAPQGFGVASRLEAELFARPGRDSEAVVTMEADEAQIIDGPPPKRPANEPLMRTPQPLTAAAAREIPLPAGARKVGELPRHNARTESQGETPLMAPPVLKPSSVSVSAATKNSAVDRSVGATAEIEHGFQPSPSKPEMHTVHSTQFAGSTAGAATANSSSAASKVTAPGATSASTMSPELAKLMAPSKNKGKSPGGAATSMHMGLNAQYQEMMKNGLPPGFATTPNASSGSRQRSASSNRPGSAHERQAGQGATRITTPAPVVVATAVQPPTNTRVPRMVAGALSVMAFCSFMLLVIQGH